MPVYIPNGNGEVDTARTIYLYSGPRDQEIEMTTIDDQTRAYPVEGIPDGLPVSNPHLRPLDCLPVSLKG